MAELLYRELTGRIIQAAIDVHKELGPGLLESAYEHCLVHLLVGRDKLTVEQQKPLAINFQGTTVDAGYRIDLLVKQKVIIELKAVQAIAPIHEAQLHTYLRLSGYRVGLLMNFNVTRMRDGIKRLVK